MHLQDLSLEILLGRARVVHLTFVLTHHLDKASRLSISIGIWILSSDTVFVSSTNSIQIVYLTFVLTHHLAYNHRTYHLIVLTLIALTHHLAYNHLIVHNTWLFGLSPWWSSLTSLTSHCFLEIHRHQPSLTPTLAGMVMVMVIMMVSTLLGIVHVRLLFQGLPQLVQGRLTWTIGIGSFCHLDKWRLGSDN